MLLCLDLMIEEAKSPIPVKEVERNASRQIRLALGEIFKAHLAGETVSPSQLASISGTSFENIRLLLRALQGYEMIDVFQHGRTRHIFPKPKFVSLCESRVLGLLRSVGLPPVGANDGNELRQAFLAMHAADVRTEDLRLNHLLRSTHGRGLCCLLFRNFKRLKPDLSVNDILEALPVSHETIRLMKKDLIDMDMVTQYKEGRRTYLHPTELLLVEVAGYLARVSVYIDKNIDILQPLELAKTG